MTTVRLLALLPLVGMAACAAKPVPPPIVDLQAMNCTSAFQVENPIPTLFDPKDEKVTGTVLDSGARCLQEKSGARVLYQVFTLPPPDTPYVIGVRAIPWADTILAPRTVVLNGEGRETRSTTHQDFTFRGQTLSTLLRSHDGDRYLVVVSDSEVLGTTVSRIVGNVQQHVGSTGFATFYWYTGTDQTNKMTLTPAGRVEVTLTPLVPDKK